MVSKAAQSALLTTLEDSPPGLFFIFCTTNPEAILDTIISRSVSLVFDPLKETEIVILIREICDKEKIVIADTTMSRIARRVHGHARDALQQLELIKLIGEPKFLAQHTFLEELFSQLTQQFINKDNYAAKETIDKILLNPVLFVEQDFTLFLAQLADKAFIANDPAARKYRDLIFYWLKNNQFLRTTNDWYLFLTALATQFEEARKTAPPKGQFTK